MNRPLARARRGRLASAAAVGLAVLGSAANPGAAQEVRLAGAPRNDAERAVADFLERGGYVLWARDTVLARDDVVPSHVLVLEASARIAGRIEGDVLVVDGDLFLRTRGHVEGNVLVLGGGFYDSDLATIAGSVTYRPNERIRVRPTEGDLEIFSARADRDDVVLDGTWGFHLPTYQRVDAVTLGWGGVFRADGIAGRPDLEVAARLKTGPSHFEGSARQSWYASDRFRIGLAASRSTITNDGWMRPVWYNSLAMLVAEDDAFDYYGADRVGVELELRSREAPIWEDAPEWRLTFAGRWEDARSLDARDPWVVWENGEAGGEMGGPDGPVVAPGNPGIDDGGLISILAGFEWSLRDEGGRTAFGIGLEGAGDRGIDGDFSFLAVEGRAVTRRILPWGHAADAFAILRADVAGTLPRQRYSTLGGPGTIPTRLVRSLRGPRLAYAEAGYAVPLLGMASMGGLDAFARASAGSAWGEGASFRLERAIMGGLAIRAFDFQLEAGIAHGSATGGGTKTDVYLDVRVRRSARPAGIPPPGRSY